MANSLNSHSDSYPLASSQNLSEESNTDPTSLEYEIEFELVEIDDTSRPVTKKRRKARSVLCDALTIDSKTRHSLGESCRRKQSEELYAKLVSALPSRLLARKRHQNQQLETIITYFACLESLLHQTKQVPMARDCPILTSLFGPSFSSVLGLNRANGSEEIVIESLVSNVALRVAAGLHSQAKLLLRDWCRKNDITHCDDFAHKALEPLEGTAGSISERDDQ